MVEVGTEFTDEETGDVVTIVSAVRHNPTEYYMARATTRMARWSTSR